MGKTAVQILHNLILEVTSHYFGCNLFIRSKELGPVLSQWEGITQGHAPQKAGLLGAILFFSLLG